MAPWRFRRCPHCLATFPGGQLRPLRYGAGGWRKKGGGLRCCPNCGHTAFTQEFPIAVDKRQRITYAGLN